MKRPPPNAVRAVIRTVIATHERTYPNPVRVTRGGPLFLSGETDEWDGWRWVWIAAGDCEGWAPDDLPVRQGDGWVAARDYSAMELTVRPGQRVVALASTHGWVWCLNDDGEEGWAPERCLAPPE